MRPDPIGDDPDALPSDLRPVEVVVVVALALVGVAARFLPSGPLWLDEALTVNVSALPVGEIPDALSRDGLPPLFYVLLHGWMSWFGEGDAAVRALSGVFGVLSLPLAFLAGRRLGGPRLGAAAVAVLALNPYAVRYATEARMYSLVIVLVLGGALLVDRSRRRPTGPVLAGVAAVSALLLYTHYWSIWLLASTALVLAVTAWRRPAGARSGDLRTLAAMAVGGVAFLPWLPTFLSQAAHTGTPWAPPSRPTDVLATTLVDFGGGDLPEARLLGATVLAVLFLVGVLGRARPPWRIELDLRTLPPAQGLAAVVALTLAVGSAAGLVGGSTFVARYAAVVFPLFVLVAATGVVRLPDRRLAGATVVVVAVLGAAVSVAESRDDRTQAGVIAEAILAGDPGGVPVGDRPVVLYCPDQLGPAVDRLLPERAFDQVVFPDLEPGAVDAPERIDWYDYRERQESVPPADVAAAVLERAGPRNAVWVVYSSTYRTPGDRCLELVDALGAEREGRAVVAADGAEYFESANLNLYLPPAPAP